MDRRGAVAPEDTAVDNPAQQRLFGAFVRQAGAITP